MGGERKRFILGAVGGVLFAAIWSGSFVATKIALTDASPLWLASIRLIVAGTVLLAVTYPAVRELWRLWSWRARGAILAAGLLSQAFYLGATYCALVTLPTVLVNIVVSTLPLVAVPAAFLVLRERPGPVDIVAAGCGVLGAIVVAVARDPHGLAAGFAVSIPIVLTVLAVVALATGNALIKPYISSAAIMPVCAVQMSVSGLVLFALAFSLEPNGRFIPAPASLGALSYLVLVGSIAGTFIWYRVLAIYTAKSAALFFLFTPVFGLSIGWSLLGETMTPLQMLGAAVVCASILLRSLVRAGDSVAVRRATADEVPRPLGNPARQAIEPLLKSCSP